MKSFIELVEIAAKIKGQTEHDVDFTLCINGKEFKPYSVSIASCDLLFFCDDCTITYLIDIYFGEPVATPHEINYE